MSHPFLARLPKEVDLLEAIAAEFKSRNMPKAAFTLIGAVYHPVVGYYDAVSREYYNKEFEGLWEVASCMGNVSERDGDLFIHAHVVLSDHSYACVGGHLMPGTEIFAAELSASPTPGETPVRKFDEATGLYLWA